MSWDEVLKEILNQPIDIDKKDKESVSDATAFKSPDLSTIKPRFDIKTDKLATFHPATSSNRISYDVKKIANYADHILSYTRQDLGLPPPAEELIRLFRWAFSHLIRRHEMFHYLVERGCRVLAESHYKAYRVKVYEEREKSGVGNLEEALADAYAIVRYLEDLQCLPEPKALPYKHDELISSFNGTLERHFISDARPPGYREAKLFIDELEAICTSSIIPVLASLGFHNEELWDWFRGMSWLFYELTILESKNFNNYDDPAAIPYSRKDFVLFIENFKSEEKTWLLSLLSRPTEST